MPDNSLSEAAQRELDKYLENERREILSRAYRRNYADKNPRPFDAEAIAEAIAEIHPIGLSSQSVAIPSAVEYQERRAHRLRFLLDAYQMLGIVIGGGGLTYAIYQVTVLLLPRTSESGSYYPGLNGAFILAYLGFAIAFLSRFFAKRWIDYRTEVLRGRSAAELQETSIEPTSATSALTVAPGFIGTFLFEWQQLEQAIRTLYMERFGDAGAGFRDMIRSIEDIQVFSNYQANQTLRGLQLRNRIVHGGPVGSISSSELRSITEDVRQLRRTVEEYDARPHDSDTA